MCGGNSYSIEWFAEVGAKIERTGVEMSRSHPVTIPIEKLLTDCTVRRGRRSGPGGQHRNKVETAITIIHEPTGVKGEASERRSQEQNRKVAIFRLRINLALKVRQVLTDADEPSETWRSRCHHQRITISTAHDDFPVILAEALDFMSLNKMDPRHAAERLGITPSQLTKLLKSEPRAMQLVNEQRESLGLSPLR